MHTGARTLLDLFHDPHYAHAAKRGSATLSAVLLAGTIWPALAQGGTRLDTPMGQAPAGVAARATAVGALFLVLADKMVPHEIVPETHRKAHEQAATLGLIGGFVVMMLLDTALG